MLQLYYNGFIPFCVYIAYFTLPLILKNIERFILSTLTILRLIISEIDLLLFI